MSEYDAFQPYPEPNEPRIVGPEHRTIQNRLIAGYRSWGFYDGARVNGYGGMVDDGRWEPVAKNIVEHYNLTPGSRILQVGAHKGFLLKALFDLEMRVYGTEVSAYACQKSVMKLMYAPFTKLPFNTDTFDLVIAASAVYTLNLPDAVQCLREIERVSKGRSWITLGAYEDDYDTEGLMMMRYWTLLATTLLTKADWLAVMEHAGYTGDYRFYTAKTLNLRLA